MQNIEIKARYRNLESARVIAEGLPTRFEKTYHQTDTYFQVSQGRLKLREFDDDVSQLIYYERPDQPHVKLSQYDIHAVPDPSRVKAMLRTALGVWAVVDKHRDVYWYDEVRIHLDSVKDLGSFLEFEGVISEASQTLSTQEKVEWLIQKFKLEKTDLVEVSYSDLLERVQQGKLRAT
ncbi:class IV adenylate cyclase [bacterium]|nr:class IV adenylate cyclase [bacterium]